MADERQAPTRPRVAVCVVTYNSAELIEDLVSSLPDGARGTEWTLVFADNDSHDGTLDAIARCAPSAAVVELGGNRGYAAGVNAAVRLAGDQDAFLILNPDVRLAPGCVAALAGALAPHLGIAVPRLVDAAGELIWSLRREPTVLRAWADALLGAERAGRFPLLGEVVCDRSAYTAASLTDWAEGSTLLVSAACWAACGGWEESFFLYSEEAEFALRARDRGFGAVYEPEALAQHLEGGSAGSPRAWSLLTVNRIRLFRRRHSRALTAGFWVAVAAREASRALAGRATGRAALRDLLSRRRWRQPPGPQWLAEVRW